MNKDIIENCLTTLETMRKRTLVFNAANKRINKSFRGINCLMDDFVHISFEPIDTEIAEDVLALIDGILEQATGFSALGSYWLYDCQHMSKGGTIIVDGVEYKLTNMRSLRSLIKARAK
jgi:hypothetical protein